MQTGNPAIISILICLLSLCFHNDVRGEKQAPNPIANSEDLDLAAMLKPVPATAKFEDPGFIVWCGTMKLCKLERPQIYLENAKPSVLFCATAPAGDLNASFNVQIPLK